MTHQLLSKRLSAVLVILAALSAAMLSLSCLSGGPPGEVVERRETVESIADYDKKVIDDQTVVVFGPCERDEYTGGERAPYFSDWDGDVHFAVWDLNSTAKVRIRGYRDIYSVVESSGDKAGVERLTSIATEERIHEWAFEMSEDNRCPFRLQAGYRFGFDYLPDSAARWPLTHVVATELWAIDRPAIPRSAELIYSSDVFRRMGFNNETGLRAPTEARIGEDGAKVLLIGSKVQPAHASQFLVEEGYEERRTAAGTLYFTRESPGDASRWRDAIYFGPRYVAFGETEQAIVELIEAPDDRDMTADEYLPFRIVRDIGLNDIGHSSAIYTVVPPEAVTGGVVDWQAAGFAYGRDGDRNPALTVAMYYSDPSAAADRSSLMEWRLQEFESSEASRSAGVPERPFETWCETVQSETFENIDGSVLRLTCVGEGDEPMRWITLVDNRDLSFLN